MSLRRTADAPKAPSAPSTPSVFAHPPNRPLVHVPRGAIISGLSKEEKREASWDPEENRDFMKHMSMLMGSAPDFNSDQYQMALRNLNFLKLGGSPLDMTNLTRLIEMDEGLLDLFKKHYPNMTLGEFTKRAL